MSVCKRFNFSSSRNDQEVNKEERYLDPVREGSLSAQVYQDLFQNLPVSWAPLGQGKVLYVYQT